jgi:hypothetical protein
MFQIVRLALDDSGEVTTRRPLQPCFELWEDAMAMAELDAVAALGCRALPFYPHCGHGQILNSRFPFFP